MKVEIILNTIFVAIIAFWAMYRGHITKKRTSRVAYSFMVLACLASILSIFAKKESVLDEIIVPWQTLFLNFSFALFCLINLWQYHLTGEFKQAFLKQKAGWLEHISNIPNIPKPPPPPPTRRNPNTMIR